MSPLEVLLWAATVWAVFLAFVIVDVPDLVSRGAERLRQHHLPHWARHGHAPPADAPPHGRHAKTTHGGAA
jgi:hypothetical protein